MIDKNVSALLPLDYQEISSIINQGGIGITPTDTVPGFICRPDFSDACARIQAAKGRADGKPFLVIARDAVSVPGVEASALKRLERLWPGSLTAILECRDPVLRANDLVIKDGSAAFRVPDSVFLRKLLGLTGGLAVSTSVNKSGAPALTDYDEIFEIFGDAVDFLIRDQYNGVRPSTIIRINSNGVSLIRDGAMPFTEIQSCIADREK